MDNEQFQEFVVKHLMKLTDKVSSMEDKVSSMENDIALLKSTVLRIETRMEHEIIDKIRILFDGYLQHDRRLDRIEKKLGINI
ncbi:hypothetical protein [Thermincola potens]|uniref:Uncharacterized protein n=1 Tax=Thermincola potens (strain JR) TaxID=635013 RepID=D5XE58_THEPJ|nr:hypothetical protein [Thermincola potens]ADG81929.1 conserved hypothetical protein [Thermincola potens JR]